MREIVTNIKWHHHHDDSYRLIFCLAPEGSAFDCHVEYDGLVCDGWYAGLRCPATLTYDYPSNRGDRQEWLFPWLEIGGQNV